MCSASLWLEFGVSGTVFSEVRAWLRATYGQKGRPGNWANWRGPFSGHKTGFKTWKFADKDVLKQEIVVLKQENDVLKQEIWSFFSKNLNSFCPGTSRDRGFCPGTFAPALVPGQRDTGTRKLFCPGTKGQRDVPSRFVPGRPAGRPVPWKH